MMRARSLLLLLVLSLPAFAQKQANEALGFHPDKLYDFSQTDSVNVHNGNLIVTIPIGIRQPVGGGFSYQLTLVFNGLLWDIETYDCDQPDPDVVVRCTDLLPNLRSNAGLGWRLSLGRLLAPTEPSLDHSSLDRYTYVYEGPSGDEHAFVDQVNPETVVVQRTSDLYSDILRMIRISATTRDVEFGDGEIHRFTYLHNAWRITQIRDRFGNALNVGYTFDGSGRETKWTLTDTSINSPARTHTIDFVHHAAMSDGWSRGQMVSAVKMDGIGGADVSWTFAYTTASAALGVSGAYSQAPLLTTINQPDGTQYTFEYHSAAISVGDWGPLKKLRYPTAGTVSYTYQRYYLPAPDVCADVSWGSSSVLAHPGVATRTIGDGSTNRVWTYVQRRGPKLAVTFNEPSNPCGAGPQDVWGPFHWTRTSILGPLDANSKRVRTDHYFNAMGAFEGTLVNPLPAIDFGSGGHTGTVGMPPPASARGPLSVIPEETTGYPADVSAWDGTRFLATQVFGQCDAQGDCTNGTLLRSEYHRYTGDAVAWRLTDVRTIYEDDAGCPSIAGPAPCFTQWTLSNPNGAGSFRTRTESSNFPNAVTRTTTTAYPQWTAGDLLNSAKPFILTLFGERTRSDGSESTREQFDFAPDTGFLRRHRVLATMTPGAHDVLRIFAANARGEVEHETIYGGDKQTLDTGTDLATLPLPATWWYRTKFTYTNGVLQSAQR